MAEHVVRTQGRIHGEGDRVACGSHKENKNTIIVILQNLKNIAPLCHSGENFLCNENFVGPHARERDTDRVYRELQQQRSGSHSTICAATDFHHRGSG